MHLMTMRNIGVWIVENEGKRKENSRTTGISGNWSGRRETVFHEIIQF